MVLRSNRVWAMIVRYCWLGLLAGLFLFVDASETQAAPRSTREVEAAVTTWVENILVAGPDQVSIKNLEPVIYEGEAVAYIAHFLGGGYCLAGADDLSRPVIFYAPEGEYDPANAELQFFLDEVRDSLLTIRKYLAQNDPLITTHLDKLAERVDLWDGLVAGARSLAKTLKLAKSIPDYLVLPVNSLWSQGSPYNDQCPTINGPPYDNVPSVVGCVATAMSQIMYYWQWPARGEGSRQVFWPLHLFGDFQSTPLENDPGINPNYWAGRLEWSDSISPPVLRVGGTWDGSMFDKAEDVSDDPDYRAALAVLLNNFTIEFATEEENFLNSYYQWDLMEDFHADSGVIDAGDEAVAKLCRDVSISVDMNWGRYSSSAQTIKTVYALSHYFKYDGDAIYSLRNSLTMIDELAWGRPVLLQGFKNSTDGHAWVVQGYDTTNGDPVFLMNLGWGPGSIGWYDPGSAELEFVSSQAHSVMIAPNYSVRFIGASHPYGGDGSPSNPYFDLAEAVAGAPDGVTFMIKAGLDFQVSGANAVLDTPHVIKARGTIISHD